MRARFRPGRSEDEARQIFQLLWRYAKAHTAASLRESRKGLTGALREDGAAYLIGN